MNNWHVLHPLLLVPNEKVIFNPNDMHLEHPAAVEYNPKDKSYKLSINQAIARQFYDASLLIGFVPFSDFLAGLSYHEVFHIKYKSFAVPLPVNSDFFKYVWNVLLDAQIEYNGTRDHPETAKYIRYALSTLRKNADFSCVTSLPDGDCLERMKNTFYYLVRFGVVIEQSDQAFVNFLAPLLLSTMRNDSKNVMVAARAVYEYFYTIAASHDLTDALKKVTFFLSATTQEDLDAAENGEALIPSSIRETLTSLEDIKIEQDQEQGRRAGKNTTIEIVERSSEFYRQTVAKYPSKIEQIRKSFQLKLDQLVLVPTYDGDLNLQKQQSAYLNSITGDAGQDYQQFRRAQVSLDHLILRDVSSSIGSDKLVYGELTVCLHAALQRLYGIRDAHIDFNGDAVVLLDFGKPIREARINPISEGGTDIGPAYELALKMKWGSVRKIINVLTDGEFDPEIELERKLQQRGITIWKWHLGRPWGAPDPTMRYTTFKTFDVDIAKAILREL